MRARVRARVYMCKRTLGEGWGGGGGGGGQAENIKPTKELYEYTISWLLGIPSNYTTQELFNTTQTHPYVHRIYTHTHTHTHTNTHTRTHSHTCARAHAHIHTHTHTLSQDHLQNLPHVGLIKCSWSKLNLPAGISPLPEQSQTNETRSTAEQKPLMSSTEVTDTTANMVGIGVCAAMGVIAVAACAGGVLSRRKLQSLSGGPSDGTAVGT